MKSKKKFSKSDKIKVLLNEKQSIRNEILILVKFIHNSLFSIVGSFLIFIGVFLKFYNDSPYQIDNVAFALSQIVFLLVLYNSYLSSSIKAQAAYISRIEKKINYIVKDKFLYWESEMVPFHHKHISFLISEVTIFLFYIAIFVFLVIFSFNWVKYYYLVVQIIEFILIGIITYLLARESNQMSEFIQSIDPLKKTPNE